MPIVAYRLLVLGVTALAVVAPLSLVVYQSFLTAPFFDHTARFGFLAYTFVFADPDFWQAFWTTIAIAGGMAAIAVPLGALLAFLMVRTDVPGRKYLEPLILIPIFVSAVVIAFGYVVAVGPVGIFSTLAKDVLGFVPWNLYSLPSLIAIASLTMFPISLYSAASRGLGTIWRKPRACRRQPVPRRNVNLPMFLPAILLPACWCFLGRIVRTARPRRPAGRAGALTYLYKLTNNLGRPSCQLMAVVVVVIIAGTEPLGFMQRLLLHQAQRYVSVRGKGLKTQPLRLHGWRWFAFAAIIFWLFITVVVPLFGITLRSFVVTWGEGVKLLDVLTLDHYRELTDYPNVIRGILNTLGIGVIGGAIAVVCYTAIALSVHRWNSGWTRLVDYIWCRAPCPVSWPDSRCCGCSCSCRSCRRSNPRWCRSGSLILSYGSPMACGSCPARCCRSRLNLRKPPAPPAPTICV